ncbi:TPA: ATP phosphoribosyltransferase [Candidatus Poribacteria bacterium]|jgi:ATP phosphoribosyltransferase|nr:ATP phosphoribosyltransferase [Candidatus Poribacteria bacterium]HIB89898.1 ATP phosphoribosyltransferase [Candidatus Poribacteria bacterium]HIB98612.1 ATP phosphoribosyltransferase [Candidatus Poribacteria bacterium]HIC19404.1 ATP phosphoribosyltransferase [Candidatus Poribacteria bacterium]HIN28885.1 ATP phosphoribosyltransferase [Candidatus Poribacteria bacterium]
MNKLKLGIPKGSMQDSTINLFKKSGYTITSNSRSYYPQMDDDQIDVMLLRPQEMALYVEQGVIDVGLAGRDWVVECGTDVKEIAELVYSKATNQSARWVLAVAKDSEITSVKDLEGKVIFTELIDTTKQYLEKNSVNAIVKFSHGATEVKIPHLCEAIVEITETGSSLRANGLKIIDTVMESVTIIIVNQEAWQNQWKRTKIENLRMLLNGALKAESKVGLKMNVAEENLKPILDILPAMRNPTISSLSQDGWYAIETIIDQHVVRELIPQLRRVGAEDIIEYPLNKVIP